MHENDGMLVHECVSLVHEYEGRRMGMVATGMMRRESIDEEHGKRK